MHGIQRSGALTMTIVRSSLYVMVVNNGVGNGVDVDAG